MPAERRLTHAEAERFGDEIRRRRESLRLSQQALSDLIGISRQHLSNVERGLSDGALVSSGNPTTAFLLALSSALKSPLRIDATHPDGLVIEFEE